MLPICNTWYNQRVKRGSFTILEVVISCFFLTIILGVISFAYYISLRSWSYDLMRIEVKSEPNIGLEKLAKDLEKATAITTADAQDIVFNTPSNTIEFSWDSPSGQLMSKQGGQTVVLANRILNFDLNYYDCNSSFLTRPVAGSQLGDICTIQIDIWGGKTYMFSTENVSLRTMVSPRNLRL